MPCYDGPPDAYEPMINEKKYGLARTDAQINRAVMCEMAKLLTKNGLKGKLSDIATKWITNHDAWDKKRGN